MGKNATAQDSSNAIKIMFEAGIRSKIIFLTGFLFETKEDLEESIRFIKEHARYVTQGLCKVNFFALTYRTPIYEDPSLFGIENIRPLATAFGIPVTFAFDEKGGLRWEEKKKQQKLYSMTLTKVMLKYVLIKKFRIKFLPPAVLFWGKKFWAFMWVKIGHLRYARMAEKFIFFLLKK